MSNQFYVNKLNLSEEKVVDSIINLTPILFDHNQNFPDWNPSRRLSTSSHSSSNSLSVCSSHLESLAACERSNQCINSNIAPIYMSMTWNSTVNSLRSNHFEVKVKVKSSAHVSYIVGKQGGKIRQIRQETSTFIQTPVNGEEPIFIIRGQEEKVAEAKMRIIQESRDYDRANYLEAINYNEGDRKRLNLFLPSRYIGLVVGRQGSVIKRIMEESGANIITPKVNTLNGFKIDGSEEEIHKAVIMIKHHIMATNPVTIEECHDNEVEITLIINN